MKLLRCAFCLSLVYASILTRAGPPSEASPAAETSEAGRALRAAGDVVGRGTVDQVAAGLSILCGARAETCEGGAVASAAAALMLKANARPGGASAPPTPAPMPVPDPRRHARAPMQTAAP